MHCERRQQTIDRLSGETYLQHSLHLRFPALEDLENFFGGPLPDLRAGEGGVDLRGVGVEGDNVDNASARDWVGYHVLHGFVSVVAVA